MTNWPTRRCVNRNNGAFPLRHPPSSLRGIRLRYPFFPLTPSAAHIHVLKRTEGLWEQQIFFLNLACAEIYSIPKTGAYDNVFNIVLHAVIE